MDIICTSMNWTFYLYLRKFNSQFKNLTDKLIYIALYFILSLKQIFGFILKFVHLNPPAIMKDVFLQFEQGRGVQFSQSYRYYSLFQIGAAWMPLYFKFNEIIVQGYRGCRRFWCFLNNMTSIIYSKLFHDIYPPLSFPIKSSGMKLFSILDKDEASSKEKVKYL